jgi:hypothetical protein
VCNIKTDILETGWVGVDYISLAQDRDRWRALVNSVMNLRVPWNGGRLSSGFTTGGPSSSAQPHSLCAALCPYLWWSMQWRMQGRRNVVRRGSGSDVSRSLTNQSLPLHSRRTASACNERNSAREPTA